MLRLVRRPKSPNWILRGSVRGIRIEESTGTSKRRAAEEIRTKRENELLQESIHGRVATRTFAEAAVSYLQHGGRHGSGGDPRFMTPIVQHFGTKRLAQIDLQCLNEGAIKLYPNATPATRNRQFYTPAVAVLRHAAKRGWCQPAIIERPHVPLKAPRWITVDEADRLLQEAAPHLRPLLVFLLYTGARIGEALWLDWHDLNIDRRHVSFPKTKNSNARGVPLHARVVAALSALPHRRGEVFLTDEGVPYTRLRHITDTSAGTRIKTAFGAACRRAGIEKFHPHCCRHTWATWHYQANRDLLALQKLGGWKSERMVLRYAHTNVAEHGHTIDALSGGNSGDSTKDERKKA